MIVVGNRRVRTFRASSQTYFRPETHRADSGADGAFRQSNRRTALSIGSLFRQSVLRGVGGLAATASERGPEALLR